VRGSCSLRPSSGAQELLSSYGSCGFPRNPLKLLESDEPAASAQKQLQLLECFVGGCVWQRFI